MFFFSGGLTLCEYSVWCCSVLVHHVNIPGMVLQRMQFKLHFTLFPEGAQRIYNEICSLDVFCFPLGCSQRCLIPLMKNNPMFLLRGSFSMKLLLLSDSSGQKVTWSGVTWLELEINTFNDWLRNKLSILCLMGVEWLGLGYVYINPDTFKYNIFGHISKVACLIFVWTEPQAFYLSGLWFTH